MTNYKNLKSTTDSIAKLATGLKMLTVFRNLIKKPLVKSFLAYSDAECVGDKSLFYAEMVSEIYSSGKTMARLVTDMVFEDENPYIKAKAKGAEISEDIAVAAERELTLLSAFVRVTESASISATVHSPSGAPFITREPFFSTRHG